MTKISINKYAMMALFAVLIVFFSVTNAHAALPSIFQPNDTDISLSILNQLFGDLVSKATTGEYYKTLSQNTNNMWLVTGLDPFQQVLYGFNQACMVMGALLGGYAITTGLMNTSNEGVFFGKDMASSFFFVRTGVSIAMIMPIFSGYCALQVVVMWVIIQGIGIADSTYKMYFGITGDGWFDTKKVSGNINDLYAMKMPSPQVGELLFKTFDGYACIYGLASHEIDSNIARRSAEFQKERNKDNGQVNVKAGENIATLKTNAGFTAVPDNLDGGLMTGYKVSGNAEEVGKESKEKEKAFYEKEQQEGDKLVQAKLESYSKAREEGVKQDLDKVVAGVFGPLKDFNGKDVQMWYYGLSAPEIKGSKTASQDASNQVFRPACGHINFAQTINALDMQRVKDRTNDYFDRQTKSGEKGKFNKYIQDVNTRRGLTETKINGKTDREVVLDVYKSLYGKYDKKIRAMAKEYVDTVNKEIRFKAVQNGKMTAQNSGQMENQATAIRRYYAEKIDALVREFETELIKELTRTYNESSNKEMQQYVQRFGKNAGSVSNLSQMKQNREEYVNYIKIAEMNAKTDGWFTAGMFYMAMTRNVGKIHELTNIIPRAQESSLYPEEYANMYGNKTNQSGYATPTSSNSLQAARDRLNYYGSYTEVASESSNIAVLQKLMPNTDAANSVAALATGLDLQNMFDSTRHPLLIMAETGHNMIASMKAYGQWMSYRETKANMAYQDSKAKHEEAKKAGKQTKAFDIRDPSTQAGNMMAYFTGAIIIMGFMLAYYLPSLPFLIWVGACAGWLVSVVEAIFIAPLWGAMHLYPHGDKYTGKGAAGYSLLMSLAFRPMLIILGLLASHVLVQVTGIFFNYIFATGMNLAIDYRSASYIDEAQMFGIIAIYAIYTIFMMGLITKLFGVITVIADKCMKWIGGAGAELGEYATIGTSETGGKLQNLGSTAGQFIGVHTSDQGREMAKDPNNKDFDIKSSVLETVNPNYTPGGISTPIRNTNDLQRYNKNYSDAEQMITHAGLTGEEGKHIAQTLVARGYSDSRQLGAFENWGNKGVFARDSEAARTALVEAANAQSFDEQMSRLSQYVQQVSTSKAPITSIDDKGSGKYGFDDTRFGGSR